MSPKNARAGIPRKPDSAAASYWPPAFLAAMDKMIRPQSVAVIGATPRMNYGGRFMTRLLRSKDRLRLYAVNPNYEEVMGVDCYPDIDALPETPDLIGVVVPYHQVLPVLKKAHARGVTAAIIISAGFAERATDDRRALQQEISDFAEQSGMRLNGPNCLGLVNITDDLWLTATSRVLDTPKGPIGLICQSGATLFGPVLLRAEDARVGFSCVISTGNEADLDFADYARYLVDDPNTRVIAGFVEGFKDAAKVIEVAKLAAEKQKPMVLIKIGRSEVGSRAARSHTASMTGSDALYDAVFAQHGIIRVSGYDELLEVAHLLASMPKPTKRGVALVSHSGGISSLTADMLGSAGMDLPVLGRRATKGINDILKGFGWAANPADVTGYANSDSFPDIMSYMHDDSQMGSLVVASSGSEKQVDQVIALRDRSKKGVAYLWTGGRGANPVLAKLREAGIPLFYSPETLASGMAHWQAYHAWRDAWMADGQAKAAGLSGPRRKVVNALREAGRETLTESESKQLIGAWGVPVTTEVRVQSAKAAADAAAEMGFPVVVKAESPDILHKSDAGIIRLGLTSGAQVREAYADVLTAAKAHDRKAEISGVLVQEMIGGGTEVIVGVSYDAQLGPTLLFGSGGVATEVYRDVALRRCPISKPQARAMIAEVKGSRLLSGFRGKPAGDVEALVRVLVAVSQMAAQLDGQLAELDINPLIVLPKGQGVKAVDALAVFND